MYTLQPLIKIAVLLLASNVLVACSGTATNYSSNQEMLTINSNDPLTSRISHHYQDWEGTPYKFGGMSKSGIDCSGFVQLTYREVFDTAVPRTTELLSGSGYNVDLNKIRVGDLLVFKTGMFKRHVGIYSGNRKFIHASSSSGVMTSSIDNPYWADAYLQTRRLTRP